MLLAALLPVALVALGLVAALMAMHLNDLQAAHQQRLHAVAQQVAAASRLGLIAHDRDQLSWVAGGALRESSLRAVSILALDGRVLASEGQPMSSARPAATHLAGQQWDAEAERDVLVQPVWGVQLGPDQLNEQPLAKG